LHWASKFGFTEGVRFLLDKAKVNINQLSEMKMRAIDVAAASGKLDIVDLFVQNYNIDPFISEQKRNCLDWAISEKQNEVVEYLKDLEVKRNLNLKRNLELEEETKESESEILPAFKKIKD
jgi:ankyrin repeat protein